MSETSELVPFQVRVYWGDVEHLPVIAANQFMLQQALLTPADPGAGAASSGDPDEVILTVGHLAPPLLQGTPDEQRAAVTQVSQVTVRPVARFSVRRAKLAELRDVLAKILDDTDHAQVGGET